VDYWTANSRYIQNKIKRTYGTDATVIYPGIEDKYFKNVSEKEIDELKKKYSLPEDFILVVSRLYDYKRVDWAIKTCIRENKNLVIVGEGPDKKYLKKIAGNSTHIKFLGFLKDDNEVITMYHAASVLLFCGVEDFGLVPIEAMAAGTPVFALREGGTLETIEEHITGEFFRTEKELTDLLKHMDKTRYNKEKILNQARKFSEKTFLNNLEQYIISIYEKETSK
jgi:glycosyltransferase involved in cell wall biosynthesis